MEVEVEVEVVALVVSLPLLIMLKSVPLSSSNSIGASPFAFFVISR